jgi:hypothetical protein
MAKRRATERDQFWLDHEVALAASGLTTKAYAAKHELSFHAFYQARKRLRAFGLLAPAELRPKGTRKSAPREPVAFSKVEIRAPREAVGEFRLSLPNGFVLEWSGPEVPEGLVGLLERLVAAR